MDLFYLSKENFKNFLFDLPQEGASRIFLIYHIVHCHEDEDSEEYPQTYYETLNQTLLTQKVLSPNTCYSLEVYGTH